MSELQNRIYELCEKLTGKKEIENVEKELTELLKPYKQGSIGLAQINTISGDIEYNAKKIVQYINHAQNIGLDLVVFPEFALIGYSLEDAVNKFPIIAQENLKWLEEIAKITTKTTALVSFADIENNSSVAVLSDGKIQKVIRKSVLSDNELVINDIKYFITVGEDYKNIDIPNESDVLISCCASPTKIKEEQLKENMLSEIAKKYSVYVIYANQVGATDNYSFDGTSRVFDKDGKLFAKAKSFEEQFLLINPNKNIGKIYPSAIEFSDENKEFSLDYEKDLERTYKTVIQGVKDYFGKTGFKRAVLGLSGGLDSTVCAVVLADALGNENVVGISMPSKITSSESKSDAQTLAENLGIHFFEAPIKDMVETTNNCFQNLFKNIEQKWEGRYKQSFTMDNIQARSRAMYLWGVSNEFGSCLPIATSDKSEAYMGYATINGDMSGGFAPIGDITKTKLFAFARWLNKNRSVKNAIPQSVIEKRPGAELAIDPKTGKALCAEDALMPYEFLDEVIWRIENRKESYDDMISSEFLYEKNHSISKEQKQQWLDKFYKRMATALYKKSILPPYVIIDSPNYEYKQPITSSKINYKGTPREVIAEQIKELL